MGLDTSHDCWHGGYMAFMRWRQHLARVIGIPLLMMEGFADGWVTAEEAETAITALYRASNEHYATTGTSSEPIRAAIAVLRAMAGQPPLSWKLLRADPIVALLNHSDCGGELGVAILTPLADRLEGLLGEIGLADPDGWHTAKTQQFIAGLRAAAQAGEPVEFR